jgi:hypothetical protein
MYIVHPYTHEPIGFNDWKSYDLSNSDKRDVLIEAISQFELENSWDYESDNIPLNGMMEEVCFYNPYGECYFEEYGEDILHVIKNSKLDQRIRLSLLELSRRSPRSKLP